MEEQRKSENALVPALRFEGFSDPWEQRTFDEFVYASGSRNADNLDLESHSVSNTSGFVPQSEQFENGGTMAEADKTAYWIVEPGSFAYNPARINVGSIGYLATRENVIVSSLYEVFRSDETCDDRFLWHWLKSALFAKQIQALQEGGVRLYFFFDKLLKSEITMPSIREQSIIGSLFDRLDSLIALHQRKHEKLKTVKQSLLEKMFPKEGEDVPEIRFEGFTDPWEQRKVGDYLVESRERGSSGDVAKKLTVKLWGKGVTEKAEISGSAHTQYYVRHAGQFIYSKLDFLNAAFGVIPDNLDEYESTADLPAFDVSNLDARFLLLKATQRSFYLRYGTIADGSRKAKRIHSEAFLAMPLFVPDYIEQTRIANLFARLDSLIALHRRELDILKNLKQALLEKMFV